jgi:very-short-patch-repair endonuclease
LKKGDERGIFSGMLRYNAALKKRARILRSHMTDSEQRLWSRLRRKQIGVVQFYRQKSIGNYVVDFYAPTARLVVEVDGAHHFEPKQADRDRRRTAYLQDQGLRVVRFTDIEVLKQLDAVVEEVSRLVMANKIPPDPPFSKGGVRHA